MLLRIMMVLCLFFPIADIHANPTQKEEAKKLFDEAETLFRRSDFKASLAKYEAALNIYPHPSILFNLGQCHRQMNNPKMALLFYRLFLSDWKKQYPNINPPNLEKVNEYIRALSSAENQGPALKEQQTTDSPPNLSLATLKLQPLPAGARVFIDGKAISYSPRSGPINLTPGDHEIRIEADSFSPWAKRISLGPGQHLEEHPSLVSLSTPDQERSTTSSPRDKLWLITGITTSALALGSIGMGIGMNVTANGTKDQDEYRTYRNVALAGYIVAGAFAITSGISFWLYFRSGPARRETHAAGVWLFPTTEGAMIGAHGCF
jgi:hypothetical protein